MPKSARKVLGSALATAFVASCGNAPGESRRQESFQELYDRQQADLAASPDVQVPELKERLRALGVTDEAVKPTTDDYGETVLQLDLTDAAFDRIDKKSLAKLHLDSRYRFELADPRQVHVFALHSGAEHFAREKAKALRELAEKGETDRIPRYRPGMDMIGYALQLESYCGYGPGDALRVIDGAWLEYTHKMASDAAIASSKKQSWAPFACVKRVVDATDLRRHFIGNRGREGAIDY